MPTPTEPNPSRSLVRDDRGAILVVAVFMSAFLVGTLWYLIGLGDACLYHDRMQDGADAVAYAAAVYHARGMNIIAMINIIMAGILAVLVALKIVQLFNNIAFAVSTVICAIPFGEWACPVADLTGTLRSPISDAVNAYQKIVNKVLPALSKTQKGIAVAMPLVAEGKAVWVASKDYNQPVQGGAMLSVSLIPSSKRLGLPVQDGSPSQLCKKAGEYVADVVFAPFGPVKDLVKKIVGGVTGTFSGYFCNLGGVGAGGSKLNIDPNQMAAKQLCHQALNFSLSACQQNPPKKGSCADQEKESKKAKKQGLDKCVEEKQKNLDKGLQKQEGKWKSLAGGMSSNDATPKIVYEPAEIGDDYFQIWSVVFGNSEWPKRADKGVEIASWDQQMVTPPAPWGKIEFAQAEFYSDDSKEDSMWNMDWQARLRRVRPPVPEVGTLLGGKIGETLTEAVGNKLAGAMAGASFTQFLTGQAGNDFLGQGFTKLLQAGGGTVDNVLQNAVMNEYDKIGVIH